MSMSMSAARSQVPQGPVELRVNMVDMRGTLDAILEQAKAREGFTLFTVNLDHVVKLNESARFRAAYERAKYVTADGWPVVWLIDRDGDGLKRTTGADLLEPMCSMAAEHGIPVYFVGPSPASQALALETLRATYPALIVAGAEAPMVREPLQDDVVAAIAGRIAASGAGLCVVSLGAPKQEVLADALLAHCPGTGFVCVGAAMDFISGHASRAPAWMQRSKLEWLWRLICDPWRLTTRYAGCALAFFKLNFPKVFRNTPRLMLDKSK